MKVSTRPASPSKRKPTQTPAPPAHRGHDIAGILLLALALVLVLALATRDAGIVGRVLDTVFSAIVGRGAWLIPLVMAVPGIVLLRGRGFDIRHLVLGLALIFLATLGMMARAQGGNYFDPELVSAGGGYVGGILASLFSLLFGGAKIVGFIAMALVGLVLTLDEPVRHYLGSLANRARDLPASMPKRPAPLAREPKARPVRAVVEEVQPDNRTRGAAVVPETRAMETKKAKPTPIFREPAPPDFDSSLPTPKEGYQLPPINLLAEALMQPKRSQSEMQKNIETLEGTLEQFGISANVLEVANGPTVTRYEIQLGPGVRVNRITSLADNIAMELAASQVRVEAPIPGKAAIGVEVPNSSPTMVTLRELCDDVAFRGNTSRLWVALGKDVSGANKYCDLTKMPHLLIGGATNSGKSIGLATLITSILMRNTPKDVRLVMIDPKRVELTLFDHIPHLMCPVIKDVKEASGVLRAVWREMDRRYELFSNEGVRNIDGWNAKASFQDRLPYIVVVIDELADLMIQCGAEVETVIVRLAQLARAVGIHMVIATQRPSVDVITGLIKANIPSRLAFSVASYIDSRTIIDQKGAEALIGKGDMLFKPIDALKPLRIQGCYVSEKEIDAVCKFWRSQQKAEYVLTPIDENVVDSQKEAGDFGDESDPLYEDSVRWAVDRGQASTSMLQRKFSIGFQRASRILDMMEERSIVGPRDGPRPRDVLVTPLDVEELFGRKRIPNVEQPE